jgi:hypothetical protein
LIYCIVKNWYQLAITKNWDNNRFDHGETFRLLPTEGCRAWEFEKKNLYSSLRIYSEGKLPLRYNTLCTACMRARCVTSHVYVHARGALLRATFRFLDRKKQVARSFCNHRQERLHKTSSRGKFHGQKQNEKEPPGANPLFLSSTDLSRSLCNCSIIFLSREISSLNRSEIVLYMSKI